jgi:hypothetical protein
MVIMYAVQFRNKKFHTLYTQYGYDTSPKINDNPV